MIGQSVNLNGRPNVIVGVMPVGFNFPGQTDVWQRLIWDMRDHSRGAHFMEAVGRMVPGMTLDQANRGVGRPGHSTGRGVHVNEQGLASPGSRFAG